VFVYNFCDNLYTTCTCGFVTLYVIGRALKSRHTCEVFSMTTIRDVSCEQISQDFQLYIFCECRTQICIMIKRYAAVVQVIVVRNRKLQPYRVI
jgi:hypothetical protein